LFSEKTNVDKPRVSQLSSGNRDDSESLETSEVKKSVANNAVQRLQRQPHDIKSLSSCNEKVSKRDAADTVIRLLTPYYKSQRFCSKVPLITVIYSDCDVSLYLCQKVRKILNS